MKNLLRALFLSLISLTAFATVHQVNSGMFYYTPYELTINVGDTVVWINDGGTHDVNGNINSITGQSFNNPESFNAPSQQNVGDTIYTHVFNIEGTYNYDCSVGNHALQGMVGSINVVDTSTVVDIISNSQEHTILYQAILVTQLNETLSGDGPFTVFAPSDDALEGLPADALDSLLANTEQLTELLLNHVHSGNVLSTDLSDGMLLPTLNETELTVSIDGMSVMIDTATVTQADLTASNGVVHFIDKVISLDFEQEDEYSGYVSCEDYLGILCEDFESYSEGSFIAESSNIITTWSGISSGDDDLQVSNNNSFSGENSLYFEAQPEIDGPHDIVIPLGNIYDEGYFSFSSRFFVPSSGSGAYFNFQAGDSIAEIWALNCFMEPNGILRFYDNDLNPLLLGNYPLDEWFILEIYIDLNQNNWEIKMNEIVLGSFENSNNQVSFINFFPLGGNQFYIDDVTYNHVEFPTYEDTCFYCEDFENVIIPDLPINITTSSLQSNYFIPLDSNIIQVSGFYVGTNEQAASSGYWNYIPEHTQFAMTNDDACLPNGISPSESNNCDLLLEVLQLPELDFTGHENLWLSFNYFHDKNWGGGDAFVEISLDGGLTWNDLSGPLNTNTVWQKEKIDLSSYYNNSSVIIRFKWSDNGSWASGFAIDDIIIDDLEEYSIELVDAYHSMPSQTGSNSTYSIIPLSQAQQTQISFSGLVYNNGSNTLNNTSVFVDELLCYSDSFDLDFNSYETYTTSGCFIPPSTGIYEFSLNASSYPVITEPVNLSFEVSEYDYARDNGVQTSGFYAMDSEIGNVFEIYSSQEIYALKIKMHSATTENAMMLVQLHLIDANGGYISENLYTGEYNYIDDEWMNIVFEYPVFVNANDMVYASISSSWGDTVAIASSTNNYIQPGESLMYDGQFNSLNATPMIRLSFDPNLTPNPVIYPNVLQTNNFGQLNLTGLPYNTNVRFVLDSNIIMSENVEFYSTNESYVEILTENFIGIWDVEYLDIFTNTWVTLIENGIEIVPGPSISNVTPNQISTNSGYIEFEISFSNIGFSFQNDITDWYHFYVYDNTTGANLYFNPISVVNDSTILVSSENYIENSSLLNNWSIEFGVDYNFIGFSGNLNANIEVNLLSACDIANDFISFNNIFSENSDTIKVCENSTISVNTYPYSISNFYWDNNSYSNNLLVNSENSRILFYSDNDTTCEINSYEFEFIELNDVAITSVTPNTCFGIDDGHIEIFSPYQFIEMGTFCCDEMGNEYIEGYSDFIFSYFTDQISFYEYLDNQNGYTNLTVYNNSNISNIYVLNGQTQVSCILDLDFDTELNNPQFYTLPFEESFDSGMPCDWNNDSQWSFGQVSDILGPYWNIPNHNQFAVSNDDACDCDMMQDRLITPPLIIDNLEDDISLSFSAFFTGDYGSIANVEISNDMGDSWQNIVVLTPSSDWQDISINISDYITSDIIQLAFRHSDSHSWGSGFAIDDVLVDFQCLDSDNDGICDNDEILGCTNTLANNFNELATEDDGTCQIDIYGCTYISAINYNPEANIDDGSCEYADFEDPCDIVPTGLFVDDIIHNRVVFNWSAPSAAPSHYMIRYRVSGTSSWTVMTAGPVNSNEFTGTSRTRYFMEPGTTYEWNIRARVLNADGSTNCQSSWSASNEYTTLDACANLENLSVSTEAVWATLSADAPAAEWGVWQSKGKMRVLGTNSFRYVNGDEYGNISNLKGNFAPSTDYEWHTKAWCTGNVDSEGNSDPMYHSGWGDFSSFTTEAPCDKMPTNLSTSANGAQTAITMSWDTPDSGAPDHYFLELTNVTTGQVWAWNNISGSDNSKTKFGLTAGDYSWRIRGACGTNGTSWATIFSQPVTYTLGGARLDNDNYIVSDLIVYPNPSRDVFNISFSSDNLQSISIRVVNVIGEEIYNVEFTDFDGAYAHELDMSKKTKGVYFLEISSEKGTLNSKMILQ